jgi:hypothetical protein
MHEQRVGHSRRAGPVVCLKTYRVSRLPPVSFYRVPVPVLRG